MPMHVSKWELRDTRMFCDYHRSAILYCAQLAAALLWRRWCLLGYTSAFLAPALLFNPEPFV